MNIIDDWWGKWSAKAAIILTTVWASLAAAWVLIDEQTQQEILSDWNLGPSSMSKIMAYMALASALSTGLIGALRVLKQKDPVDIALAMEQQKAGKVWDVTTQPAEQEK